MGNLFQGFPVTRAKIADMIASDAPPALHKLQHQASGTDEITVQGLLGILIQEQLSSWAGVSGKPSAFAPSAHKSSHEDGGADEITVQGLLGILAQEQLSSWAGVSGKPTAFAPSAHKTSHQLGGSDELDVTGLVGAGGGAAINEFAFLTWFEALTGYAQTVTESATITISQSGLILATGSTAASLAHMTKSNMKSNPALSWDRNTTIIFNTQVIRNGFPGPTMNLLYGSNGNARHIGFKFEANNFFGTVGNVSGETTTLLEALSNPPTSPSYTLKCVYTAGVKCDFYVDNVLTATITTGLPSGTTTADQPLLLRVENNASGANCRLVVSNYNFLQSII
jgi:xanthosine utilization system XapX-like protein